MRSLVSACGVPRSILDHEFSSNSTRTQTDHSSVNEV